MLVFGGVVMKCVGCFFPPRQVPMFFFCFFFVGVTSTQERWFQTFLEFSPVLGKIIQFDQYFSNGSKPPTRLYSKYFWGLQ